MYIKKNGYCNDLVKWYYLLKLKCRLKKKIKKCVVFKKVFDL